MDAVDELVATFAGAGLPIPPIPAAMRSSLEQRAEWLWSTRPVDPLEMYIFRQYPAETMLGPVQDYLAISHAGHGANSYSINFHLVQGPLALFTQTGWGGVYMDNGAAVALMTSQFAGMAQVIAAAERITPAWTQERRLLVLESTFRSAAACQWFVPGDGSVMQFQNPPDVPSSVFDLAIAELASVEAT